MFFLYLYAFPHNTNTFSCPAHLKPVLFVQPDLGILEDCALPSIEIIPKADFYDYENKYQPGAAVEVCPAEIPAEIEERLRRAALRVYETLGLSVYSRADFILDSDGEIWFLEINTLPGMTPTSLLPQEAAAAGIDYSSLCG